MKQTPMNQTLKQNPTIKPRKQLTMLSLFTQLFLLTQLTLIYPVQAWVSNPSESLLLKKTAQYIHNSTYLIDEAQALQNVDARYRFKYHLLRQDLSEIAGSINRYLNQDKRNQTPRTIAPLIKAY